MQNTDLQILDNSLHRMSSRYTARCHVKARKRRQRRVRNAKKLRKRTMRSDKTLTRPPGANRASKWRHWSKDPLYAELRGGAAFVPAYIRQ